MESDHVFNNIPDKQQEGVLQPDNSTRNPRTGVSRAKSHYNDLDTTDFIMVAKGKHKNACKEVQMFGYSPNEPNVYHCQFYNHKTKEVCGSTVKITGSNKRVSDLCKKHMKNVHHITDLDNKTLLNNVNPPKIIEIAKRLLRG